MLFEMGQITTTTGICQSEMTGDELGNMLFRHMVGDWGIMCEEDRQANDDALRSGGRLLSRYMWRDKYVYVITELDRSETTVLFSDEY